MKKRRVALYAVIPVIVLIVIATAYLNQYYRADSTALDALVSDEDVTIKKIDSGWLFDGPSKDTALIFYPGAKVEETAYATLLHQIAKGGIDVFLVKMPARLALFGINEAETVQQAYAYDRWYIGGHSMGGAMAALYAAEHGENLDGLILCAAYATKPLDSSLKVLSICGTEDKVLNMEKYEAGKQYLPVSAVEHMIVGGNHAQFGSYGIQSGDGIAKISAEAQQEAAVECIISTVKQAVITDSDNQGESVIDPPAPDFVKQPPYVPAENDAQIQDEGETEEPGAATLEIALRDVDGNGKNYTFTYGGEDFKAQYTTDNWKIVDSYKITDTADMTAICQALLDVHPVHGRDMQSIRTAEDMAFEWQQHNLVYELFPENNSWRQSAKDVDLNPADQNKTLQEMYEDRTGKPFRLEDFIK